MGLAQKEGKLIAREKRAEQHKYHIVNIYIAALNGSRSKHLVVDKKPAEK